MRLHIWGSHGAEQAESLTAGALVAVNVERKRPRRRSALKCRSHLLARVEVGHGPRLKNIHALGYGKCPAAASAIALGIESFGAGHRRREFCLQALLGPFQGLRCWLAIQLGANRLWCRQSRVRISRGLAHGRFELGDVFAAGTGLGGGRAQAENRANDWSRCSKGCHPSSPSHLLNIASYSIANCPGAMVELVRLDPLIGAQRH